MVGSTLGTQLAAAVLVAGAASGAGFRWAFLFGAGVAAVAGAVALTIPAARAPDPLLALG
jgi:hypothetical protein